MIQMQIRSPHSSSLVQLQPQPCSSRPYAAEGGVVREGLRLGFGGDGHGAVRVQHHRRRLALPGRHHVQQHLDEPEPQPAVRLHPRAAGPGHVEWCADACREELIRRKQKTTDASEFTGDSSHTSQRGIRALDSFNNDCNYALKTRILSIHVQTQHTDSF